MKTRVFAFISALLALLGIFVLFVVPIYSINLLMQRGPWTTFTEVMGYIRRGFGYLMEGRHMPPDFLFTATAMYMAIGAFVVAAILLIIGIFVKKRRVLMIIGCAFMGFGLSALYLFYLNYTLPSVRLMLFPDDIPMLFKYVGPGIVLAPLLLVASIALGIVSAVKEHPKKEPTVLPFAPPPNQP